MLKIELSENSSSIIKVIGVGGGGSNAVTHMHRQGIQGVDFVICNTDAQALKHSDVPIKIQLGSNLTNGLGAGSVPSVGKNAAIENIEDLRKVLANDTRMLFITAGMGGGTGTGAAPVIAALAREMGILTVGIVTIPFSFEGRKRKCHAEEGIMNMKKSVDALLVICNDKLRDVYGNLKLTEAFGKADNILLNAARGIAEIITVVGQINVDFEDVKTVMRDSGVALMGTGIAEGENRAMEAVEMALASPLLDNNDIEGAANILLYITSGTEEISMDEVTEITDFIQSKTKSSAEIIWGNGHDETLGNRISITIIATGFDNEHRVKEPEVIQKVKVGTLFEENTSDHYTPEMEDVPVVEKEVVSEIRLISQDVPPVQKIEMAAVEPETAQSRTIIFDVNDSKPVETMREPITEPVLIRQQEEPVQQPAIELSAPSTTDDFDTQADIERRSIDRIQKLRSLSVKLKTHVTTDLAELESIPAFKRRNVELTDIAPSNEPLVAKYSLGGTDENGIEIKTENSFLHDNVD